MAWELALWLVGSSASACDSDNSVFIGSEVFESKWQRKQNGNVQNLRTLNLSISILFYDAANILRHDSLNLSIARTLLQAKSLSEHLSALRQKCEVRMTPALSSDIILNFHRLAPRLNHLSQNQLKRSFKILLANLLHIVKKAVVLKIDYMSSKKLLY